MNIINCIKCSRRIAGISEKLNSKYQVRFNCPCGYSWSVISESSPALAEMFDKKEKQNED